MCLALGIKLGFTFSHGVIDYVVCSTKSHGALWLLVFGPLWAVVYYGIFRFAIRRFNLKTPGRELEDEAVQGRRAAVGRPVRAQLVRAFGGRVNIASLDACITRLRVKVGDVTRPAPRSSRRWAPPASSWWAMAIQAIFGTRART